MFNILIKISILLKQNFPQQLLKIIDNGKQKELYKLKQLHK